jgi:hypothetical protein
MSAPCLDPNRVTRPLKTSIQRPVTPTYTTGYQLLLTPQYGLWSLFTRYATPRFCKITLYGTSLPAAWCGAINIS